MNTVSGRSDKNWFGTALLLVPALAVAGHLLLPNVFLLKLVANFALLVAGSFLFAAWGEMLTGATEFSLPFATILIVVIIGIILFFKFGWLSTIIILGVYGGMCVLGGLTERSMHSKR